MAAWMTAIAVAATHNQSSCPKSVFQGQRICNLAARNRILAIRHSNVVTVTILPWSLSLTALLTLSVGAGSVTEGSAMMECVAHRSWLLVLERAHSGIDALVNINIIKDAT